MASIKLAKALARSSSHSNGARDCRNCPMVEFDAENNTVVFEKTLGPEDPSFRVSF